MQLTWKPSNYCNVSSWKNTLIQLTHYDETKKRTHDIQTLENVQSTKYLGITITENMDWGHHITDISSKATKTLGFFEGTWLSPLGVLRRLHTKLWYSLNWSMPGRVAQSVTYLATDACLTADPGVVSSIPVRSHTFMEIDHEIISMVILLPSADSFKKGCCQLQAKVCAQITG